MKQAIVIDHDGTLTDPLQEYASYRQASLQYLLTQFPDRVADISKLFPQLEQRILNSLDNFGWEFEGKIVSSISDQYLIIHALLDLLLPKLGFSSHTQDIANFKANLFKACYHLTPVCYRIEVLEFIANLVKKYQVYIVTNSETNKVHDKLVQVLPQNILKKITLVGNAKKMQVDLSWEGVVPTGIYLGFPGSPKRGIYLQRHAYYQVLTSIFGEDLSKAIVIGDNAELDLAMVDYLGGKSLLVKSAFTPEWEQKYWSSDKSSNRQLINSLTDVLKSL